MKTYCSILFTLATTIFLNGQNLQWVNDMGAIAIPNNYGHTEVLTSITDTANNVYCAGFFQGTVDFDPDTTQLLKTSNGQADMFISKYDEQGNFLWVKQMGGPRGDTIIDMDINASGSLILTGSFSGTVDFDPNGGVFNMTSSSSAMGFDDMFVMKMTKNGIFQWAKRIGSWDVDRGRSVELDANGNIYVAGEFSGNVDFDPGSGTHMIMAPNFKDNGFVLKLNGSGVFEWAKAFTSTSNVYNLALAVDDSGYVYTTGKFFGTVDMDPNTGVVNLTATGWEDMFVQKMSNLGNLVWVRQFGGGSIQANDMKIDSTHIYLTGHFYDTIDFNPGTGIHLENSHGIQDIFILKLSTSGQFNWVKTINGTSNSTGLSIDVGSAGEVYSSGMFVGYNIDFDPSPNSDFLLTEIGFSGDGYIHGLTSQGDFLMAKKIGGTIWDNAKCIHVDKNQDLIVGGSYANTANFNHPNTYNLTTPIGNNWPYGYIAKYDACFSRSINVTACDSFTTPSGSQTFYTSGTHIDSIVKPSCTSYLTYNVLINMSKLDSMSVSSCGNYTSPSGNHVWQSSGSYSDTLVAVSGCDSILNINLTVTNIDTSVSQNGVTLSASHLNANYQWLDCLNGLAPIAGANGQSFTATINGSYAVEITENGCVDTSSCFVVSGIGLPDLKIGELGFEIFPNPTSENVTIRFEALQKNVEVEVFDVLGRLISSVRVINTAEIPLELPIVSGVYLIKINTGGSTETIQITKQ